MKNTTSLCDTALNSLHISSFPYNEGNKDFLLFLLLMLHEKLQQNKKNAFYFSFPLLQEKKILNKLMLYF